MKTIQHKKRTSALLAVFLFILSTHLRATDSPAPISLSLNDAVKMAVEQNPMIAGSRGEADAAAARARMAGSQRRPSLSTTAFLTNGDMNGILTGPSSVMPTALSAYPPNRYYDQNIMFMAPLDVSGKLAYNARAAGRRSTAAGFDSERTRQDVVFEVRMSYYEVLYQEQRASAYENAVAAANEMLKNDQAAVDAGKAPPYYLDRDRAEVAMNQQMLAETRREAATARIRLAALLGLDPATPLDLTDKLAPPDVSTVPVSFPADTPDLSAARARVDAARDSDTAARRAFAPDVSLTFMSDRIASHGNEVMNGTTAAIIVGIPLWDGGMRRASKSEAAAMQTVAAQELRALELKLKSDFMSARLEYDTALQNITTADTAVKSAEENYRVAKIRYEAGKGILVEMLDALTALTRARVNRVQAVRDALVSRDMLLRIAGML